MAVSKQKLATNARWDAKNMVSFSIKLRKPDADTFRAACAANGTTAYSVLLAAARAYIAAHPVQEPAPPSNGPPQGPSDAPDTSKADAP